MNNIIPNIKVLKIKEIKNLISNSLTISELQSKLDRAEKVKEEPFSDFSDIDMLNWFLYRRKNLNEKNDSTVRTKKEYEREFVQFIQNILQYAEEIDIDLSYSVEDSLFKSLEKRHIRRYQEWLAASSPYVKKHGKYSPATLARKTTILKSFLRYLYESDYIEQPLHEGLYIASVRADDRPDRDLGPKEVVDLLNHFKNINHPIAFCIIHVLTTTGLRNEEFCKLKKRDLKWDSVNAYYYLDVVGKGNKKRQIPLRNKVVQSIHAFREARGLPTIEKADENDPIFTTNTGNAFTPSYLSQYLTKMVDRSNLAFLSNRSSKIGPHTFRHAFAIISHISKVDLFAIQKSLGHEKIDTTMIYMQKVLEREQHAIHDWTEDVLSNYI